MIDESHGRVSGLIADEKIEKIRSNNQIRTLPKVYDQRPKTKGLRRNDCR